MAKILVTGAKGFVGKNLCAQLNNIKDGKARCYGDVTVEVVYEYDLDSTPEQLDEYFKNADFVFEIRTTWNSLTSQSQASMKDLLS